MGSGASVDIKKEININDVIKFGSSYYNVNIDNKYFIIRKFDDVILYLGKIIKYEKKYEFVRMCWHDGPIYDFSHNEIIFENFDNIDDKNLIESFKKLNEDSIKYIIKNYSNLYIV